MEDKLKTPKSPNIILGQECIAPIYGMGRVTRLPIEGKLSMLPYIDGDGLPPEAVVVNLSDVEFIYPITTGSMKLREELEGYNWAMNTKIDVDWIMDMNINKLRMELMIAVASKEEAQNSEGRYRATVEHLEAKLARQQPIMDAIKNAATEEKNYG